MQKLINQLVKFGIVGFVCFLIDFGLTVGLTKIGVHYLVSAFVGFIVSVIANYLLTYKFVFKHKENLDRKKEFIIFILLSAIGCGINELILWISIDKLYLAWDFYRSMVPERFLVAFSKIVATGIVMIYNFITRKIFLSESEN